MTAAKNTSSKTAARQRQFPAKAGQPDVEVAERSADGSQGARHVKEFVVPAATWPATHEEQAHTANAVAVVSEAIQRGLHPRGDVSFDGASDHPDGVSLTLTYSVETVPASIDHTPGETTTPRDVATGTGADRD